MMTSIRTANGKLRLRNGTRPALVTVAAILQDLFVAMSGQSNIVHLSSAGPGVHYYTTSLLAKRWTGTAFGYVSWHDPLNQITPGTPYNQTGGNVASGTAGEMPGIDFGDGICNFVNKTVAATGRAINVFEYAQIGSMIEQWIDDGSANCWSKFKGAVVASGKKITDAIWYQGEDYADQPLCTVADYKAKFRQVHTQHSSLSADSSKFRMGVVILGPCAGYSGTPEGKTGIVRQAMLEYVVDPANVGAYIAASAHDLSLAPAGGADGGDTQIHITNASEARLGLRLAKSLAARVLGTGHGAEGPKIIGAARSSLQVDVAVQHVGGTALLDGVGGNGSQAMAFRFFDAGAGGAQIAYTPVGIVGPNTIRFTLASAPVGALTMDHGMANAPYGVPTNPASVIYDNDTVPGDTLGCPLQPCALMPVTVTGG